MSLSMTHVMTITIECVLRHFSCKIAFYMSAISVSENTSSSSDVSGGGKSSSTPQSGKMSLINSEKNSLKRKSEGGGGGGGGGRGNSGLSMNEVIKLHQDEGVMHLLHGLPSR